MRIDLSVEYDSQEPGLWRGLITLKNNSDMMTVETENRWASPNGAWAEVIGLLQDAVDRAQLAAVAQRLCPKCGSPRRELGGMRLCCYGTAISPQMVKEEAE